MKKSVKYLALMLGCTAAVTGLSGCGKDKEAVSDGGKPTLSYLMPYCKQDPNTYATAKMLENETGYHVEYTMLPQDNPGEKLNLMIASKEPYDIVVVKNDLRVNWADYANKGALLQLDDMVDKYGANMKKAMKPTSFDLMRIDGKLFGIPTPSHKPGPKFGYANMLTARKDMLDKIGAKSPATIDEFTDVLKKFKSNVKLENGQDFAPLSINTDINIPGVVGAFGVPNAWNDVNGKLVHRVEDPGYLDYIKYLASLYKEGLLDRTSPQISLLR